MCAQETGLSSSPPRTEDNSVAFSLSASSSDNCYRLPKARGLQSIHRKDNVYDLDLPTPGLKASPMCRGQCEWELPRVGTPQKQRPACLSCPSLQRPSQRPAMSMQQLPQAWTQWWSCSLSLGQRITSRHLQPWESQTHSPETAAAVLFKKLSQEAKAQSSKHSLGKTILVPRGTLNLSHN